MVPTAEKWLREKRALSLPTEAALRFEEFLNTLPWLGSSLNWSRMPPAVTINVANAQRRDLLAWGKKTRIGSHTHMAIWYSAEEGGVVVGTDFGLLSLDELYRGAPGVRFAFGVDWGAESYAYGAYADLLEYGAGDKVTALGT